jgi:hypothetical protein
MIMMTLNHDMPPGYAAEMRQDRLNWIAGNARLLETRDDRHLEILVEMASSAVGGATRAIARSRSREEADEVVNIAMEIFAKLVTTVMEDAHSRPAERELVAHE